MQGEFGQATALRRERQASKRSEQSGKRCSGDRNGWGSPNLRLEEAPLAPSLPMTLDNLRLVPCGLLLFHRMDLALRPSLCQEQVAPEWCQLLPAPAQKNFPQRISPPRSFSKPLLLLQKAAGRQRLALPEVSASGRCHCVG